MEFNVYSKSELAIIESSIACGFSLDAVADELNKRFHKNELVRNVNGLKKKIAKMKK